MLSKTFKSELIEMGSIKKKTNLLKVSITFITHKISALAGEKMIANLTNICILISRRARKFIDSLIHSFNEQQINKSI